MNRLLQWFYYTHLPLHLQEVAAHCCELARTMDTALAPAARTAESALQAANAAGIEVPQLMRLVLDIHHILRELLDDGPGLPAAIPVEAGPAAPQGQQT